jgi:CheY-like chemotaxis protein
MGVGGKAVILVVDDEPSVVNTLAMVLEQAGYSVLTANTGQEAIDIVAGVAVDLALVDVDMPRMNGISLAREIRKRLAECKIILISGAPGASELIDAALAEGVEFDVVAKPVPPADLLEQISGLLRGGNHPRAA